MLAAVWLGLLTGLVEGAALWTLQRFNLLGGQIRFLGLSTEAFWVTPVFDLLLFLSVAAVLSVLARAIPRLPLLRLTLFALTSLMFLNWVIILMAGRLSIYAMLLLALGLGVQSTRWLVRHEVGAARFWRRTLPALGVVAGLVVIGLPVGSWLQTRRAVSNLPQADPGTPNILVIVIDTLRADHLSSYGYTRGTSPTIDRLAQQGVLFEKAYSTSSWTLPAHASMLTGRYTSDHGVDKWRTLDDTYPTIGAALQGKGYRTATFSANVEVFNRRMGFGRGFHRFEDNYRSLSNTAVNTLYGRIFEYYVLHKTFGLRYRLGRVLADDINRSVLRWAAADPERPFFAVLNYFDVHSPYIPPQPYRSRFSTSEEPGGLINTDWGMDQIYMDLTPEQLQGEVDAYDGAIAYVDDRIAELLRSLEELGRENDTLIVLLSDHGESFGEHGLLEHHNSLYPEVVQVPLIMWGPKRVPAGLRVATPTTIAAIPATLLDLTGEPDQQTFPGPSLRQLWETSDPTAQWPLPVAEVEQVSWVPPQHLPFHGSMSSVIGPEWQYIQHDTLGEELLNVAVEPPTQVEFTGNPELTAVKDALKGRLATELNDRKQAPRQP